MSRLADVLATLRDAAEAIAPAAVEERREHVAEVLRLIFGERLHKAPRTVQDAVAVVSALRSQCTRLEDEIDNLRAETEGLRAEARAAWASLAKGTK